MSGPLLFANVAHSTLAGAITSTATTAQLASGTGVLFPQPAGGGQYFLMTFNDAATGLLREIVRVTNVTVDTITMVRAQEGTIAQNWSAGDFASNKLTAGSMAAMTQDSELQSLLGAFAVDFGSANALDINLTPAPLNYGALTGVPLRIQKSPAANTGACTLECNGLLPAQNLVWPNGRAIGNSELVGSAVLTVVYDGVNFEVQSVSNAAPRVFTFAGNPNTHVAGAAASGNQPPDFCWDTTDGSLWTCVQSGSTSTAVWAAAGQPSGGGVVVGPSQALKLSAEVVTAGPSVTFTADAIAVAISLGKQGFTLASFNQTLSTSSTGPGGMDTGVPPIDGFVAIYAIYNPVSGARAVIGTIQCQTSTYTGASMPVGYTASSLIAIWPTDGSGHFIPGSVVDRWFFYLSPVANGGLFHGTSLVQVPVSLSGFVPTAAREVSLTGDVIETVAIDGSSIAAFQPASPSATNIVLVVAATVNLTSYQYFIFPLITPQTVYYFVGKSSCLAGLNVNGYQL